MLDIAHSDEYLSPYFRTEITRTSKVLSKVLEEKRPPSCFAWAVLASTRLMQVRDQILSGVEPDTNLQCQILHQCAADVGTDNA